MADSILDELGQRYIGDPKTVGLSDSVYSDVLRFDAEEFSQKTMKKRYLVSMTLGEKYDVVAVTVVNQVRLLVNVVGFVLLILSVGLIGKNVGGLLFAGAQAATASAQAKGQAQQADAPLTSEQQNDVLTNYLGLK